MKGDWYLHLTGVTWRLRTIIHQGTKQHHVWKVMSTPCTLARRYLYSSCLCEWSRECLPWSHWFNIKHITDTINSYHPVHSLNHSDRTELQFQVLRVELQKLGAASNSAFGIPYALLGSLCIRDYVGLARCQGSKGWGSYLPESSLELAKGRRSAVCLPILTDLYNRFPTLSAHGPPVHIMAVAGRRNPWKRSTSSPLEPANMSH